MNNLLILLPLMIPIFGSLSMAFSKIIKDKYMKPAAVLIVIVNFFSIFLINNQVNIEVLHIIKMNEFIDIYFRVDQLGKLFSYMAGSLWIITSFYSLEYMKHEGKERRYFTFFILTLGIVMGISYSGNLFTLYIYYELLTLSTFPLVIHADSSEALQIGKKYIIYSFVGATFIILGMMILFSITGNLNFTGGGISDIVLYPDKTLLLISFLSMFIGFGVKAAMVPFHSWLPAAMVAPTPVSALLHAVAVVKSGIFALLRTTYYIFGPVLVKELNGDKFLIPLVIATIIMGSMIALHQENLKKRLAYSTISQLGYIILGILMLNPEGLIGAILHMINHAVIKITLFFVVGSITYMTGKKYINEIHGLGKKMQKTFLVFTVAAISLVGIPPTNGFVSKWMLGIGAMDAGQVLYIIILLFSAFLTAAYLFPIAVEGFFKKEEIMTEEGNMDPPKMMMVPMVVLAITIIFLGLFPNGLIRFIEVIVQDVF
ncbi:MAG: monovalent cation/H+ antiporter subunit D family protein [Clostridiales bacterium]|nr:monovalent cation/H+ antiporter subunit D family protein [Clostridiales bacterium]